MRRSVNRGAGERKRERQQHSRLYTVRQRWGERETKIFADVVCGGVRERKRGSVMALERQDCGQEYIHTETV